MDFSECVQITAMSWTLSCRCNRIQLFFQNTGILFTDSLGWIYFKTFKGECWLKNVSFTNMFYRFRHWTCCDVAEYVLPAVGNNSLLLQTLWPWCKASPWVSGSKASSKKACWSIVVFNTHSSRYSQLHLAQLPIRGSHWLILNGYLLC